MDKRKGFTLVEMLVVITIIGMLSALITGAVMGALRAAKRSRIKTELGQVAIAVEDYKTKYGEYPPDLYETASTLRHMKKRWPRFVLSGNNANDQVEALREAVNNVYRSSSRVTLLNNMGYKNVSSATTFMGRDLNVSGSPDGSIYLSAIPFWLGGFPNSDGKFAGFSGDPEAPLGRIYESPAANATELRINNGSRAISGTEEVRLGTQDNQVTLSLIINVNISFASHPSGTYDIAYPCYVNDMGSGEKVPYVYFRGRSDGGPLAYCFNTGSSVYDAKYYDFPAIFGTTSTLGMATPYARPCDPFGASSQVQWFEPEKYQIIHPGLDGVFGATGAGDTTTVAIDSTSSFRAAYFRSVNPNAAKNTIGQADYDNITSFTAEPTLESEVP